MRRFIYKNELYYLFEKRKIDETKQNYICKAIFTNPFSGHSQYILKIDIIDKQALEKHLEKIDKIIINEIIQLFFISDDLILPNEIKSIFENKEKFALMVGAGVSKLMGVPLWYELAHKAIKKLEVQGKINHHEYDKLINDIKDPKQLLTIFDTMLPRTKYKQNGVDSFYKKLFQANSDKVDNPYDYLATWDCVKFTTNIDGLFEKSIFDKETLLDKGLNNTNDYCVDTSFTIPSVAELTHNMIYHLHGTMDSLDKSILTTADYLRLYFENDAFSKFLKEVFSTYKILFIGYGLEEFVILEKLFNNRGQVDQRYYVLLGTYLNESNVFAFRNRYLKQLGIQAIPYYLDFNGYFRLNLLLKNWTDEIKETALSVYAKQDLIDQVLNDEA